MTRTAMKTRSCRAGSAPFYAASYRPKSRKPRDYWAFDRAWRCIQMHVGIDPFGGSGSTLIACEQLGRICHTIELDEKYCDVIVKRYIEQVGSADTVSVIRDGKTIRFEDLEVSGDGK